MHDHHQTPQVKVELVAEAIEINGSLVAIGRLVGVERDEREPMAVFAGRVHGAVARRLWELAPLRDPRD